MQVKSVCQCRPGWSLTKFIPNSPVRVAKFELVFKHSHKASNDDLDKTEQGSTSPRNRLFNDQHFSHRQECDEAVKLIEMLQHAESL